MIYFAGLVVSGIVGVFFIAVGLDDFCVFACAGILVAFFIGLQQFGSHADFHLIGLVLLLLEFFVGDELHDAHFFELLGAHALNHFLDLGLERLDFGLDVDLLNVGLALGVALALQALQTLLR